MLVLSEGSFREGYQQKFEVPNTEALYLVSLFWGWGLPDISLEYSLYLGEYLFFRYLKCLMRLHASGQIIATSHDLGPQKGS